MMAPRRALLLAALTFAQVPSAAAQTADPWADPWADPSAPSGSLDSPPSGASEPLESSPSGPSDSDSSPSGASEPGSDEAATVSGSDLDPRVRPAGLADDDLDSTTDIAASRTFELTATSSEAPSSSALATARARARLSADHGWASGTIGDQLDRDPTLVPYGKGAVFVPALSNPLDEPTVTVFSGGRLRAQGKTGERIVLAPGTYEVRLGSGADNQRIRLQATVREDHTTVVPVSWAGLAVHVVDELYASVRGSYELIRVEDREYIGLGFGRDEQAGEPVSTWILRPGLYKIVRVGENYRARRDFATVRLVEGQLTHFLLVIDPVTGSFSGGGEVPEEELFRPRNGVYGSLVLGGDAAMNARNNVLGSPDGISFTLRAFIDARASLEIAKNPLIFRLQVEEGQTKSPDLPWQKSNDRAELDGLYIYRLAPWVGPYARIGARVNLIRGEEFYENPTNVAIFDASGQLIRRDLGADRLRLSPSFGLTTLKEGAGLHLRLFKEIFAESTLRTGFGARHRLARDLYERNDDEATPEVEYREIESTNQVGLEATLLGSARITRWVTAALEFDSLLPFSGTSDLVLEVEGSIALKLTSYAAINYRVRFLRDPALTAKDVLEQDVLLRLSLEIL